MDPILLYLGEKEDWQEVIIGLFWHQLLLYVVLLSNKMKTIDMCAKYND